MSGKEHERHPGAPRNDPSSIVESHVTYARKGHVCAVSSKLMQASAMSLEGTRHLNKPMAPMGSMPH